jgi:tRNA A-37 threonylcarbamoyl transferase component Bud32
MEEDYLPYGEIPENAPIFNEVGVTSLDNYLSVIEPSDYFNTFMDNALSTSINDIYRRYRSTRTPFRVSEIFVNKYGFSRLLIDANEDVTDFDKRTELYNTISDFVYKLKSIMYQYEDLIEYMYPHILKVSRYLWNRYPNANNYGVTILVISNAVKQYIKFTGDGELPYDLSVSTITENGTFDTINVVHYINEHKNEIKNDISFVEGFGKFREYEGRMVFDKKNPLFQSYISHKMINSFLNELSLRIRNLVPNFSESFIDDYFISPPWSKIKQLHNISLFEVSINSKNHTDWKVNKYLSSGKYGSVHEVCSKDSCRYVMKVQKEISGSDAFNEIIINKQVSRLGLAPEVLSSDISDNYSIVVTEELDRTLDYVLEHIKDEKISEFVVDTVMNALDTLHKNGIVHGDAHGENIMFVSTKSDFDWNNFDQNEFADRLRKSEIKLKFIDFGFSITKKQIDEFPDEVWKSYVESGIFPRLKKLGCISPSQPNAGKPKLFEMLKFYDYANIFIFLLGLGRIGLGSPKSIAKVMEKQRELGVTSGCTPGATY